VLLPVFAGKGPPCSILQTLRECHSDSGQDPSDFILDSVEEFLLQQD
jgi:hypothetical protein